MSADFSAIADSLLPGAIGDALANAIARAEADLRDEHAPLGLDARPEVALHPLLAGGLADAGWGVHREIPYPADTDTDTGVPTDASDGEPDRDRAFAGGPARDSGRDRCDLVLTDRPGVALLDPVHADRRVRAASGTLFADLAPAMEADASAEAVRPEDAFWLEIKSVAQYAYRDGVPGPNRSYASEMLNGPAADVCKLVGDGLIARAAVALVLFTEAESVATNDAAQVAHALLDMGLPIAAPEVRTVPIADRAGNAFASVAVFGIRGLGLPLAFDE